MKNFLEKFNIKRINLFWFIVSLSVSLGLYLVQGFYFKTWDPFVSGFLSMTALPALFISCLVLNSIDDVKEQVKSEEENRVFFDRRRKQALNIFVDDYTNVFKTHSLTLKSDLDKIITTPGGFSDDFITRIKSTSYHCLKSLERYAYVESWIQIRQKNKEMSHSDDDQEVQSLSFKPDTLSSLKNDLDRCYQSDNETITDVSFCKELNKKIQYFEDFCSYLFEEAGVEELPSTKIPSGDMTDNTLSDDGAFYE